MNTIEFIETDRCVEKKDFRDRYEFRSDKKYHLLQKICFRVLNYIGAFSCDEVIKYTRHSVNVQDMVQKIYEQDYNIFEIYNHRGYALLVGNKEYMELTGNPELRQMTTFSGKYYFRGEIMQMKIIVIPWMIGMLVVPKNVFE